MRIVLLIAVAGLAACTKQGVVKSNLVESGVAAPVADCMSQEMAKRLTIEQLQKLGRADTGDGKSLTSLTVADYIDRATRVGDPEVVAVTGLAAAYCRGAR